SPPPRPGSGDTTPTPGQKPRPTPGFQQAVAEDLKSALRTNAIDLGIRVAEPPLSRTSHFDKHYVCTILYLEGSPRSPDAKELVERCLAAANNRSLWIRLSPERVANLRPVQLVSPQPEPVKQTGPKEMVPLSLLVPLILILMTITGAVYPAIDLTAGERER